MSKTISILEAKKILERIPEGTERAVPRVLNRAVTHGRVVARKGVAAVYTVKSSDVSKSMTLQRATKGNLEAGFSSKGGRLPIHRFTVKPTNDTTGNRRAPVRVRIRKDSGLQSIDRAFIHKGRVLRRVGRSRMPIQYLHSMSVPGMINAIDGLPDEINDEMEKVAMERLDHEVEWVLKGGK